MEKIDVSRGRGSLSELGLRVTDGLWSSCRIHTAPVLVARFTRSRPFAEVQLSLIQLLLQDHGPATLTLVPLLRLGAPALHLLLPAGATSHRAAQPAG